MNDNQIKSAPKCEKCGLQWSKISPLGYYYNVLLCGNCLIEVQRKDNQRRRSLLLQENDEIN